MSDADKATYNGKIVSQMTRDELIAALLNLGRQIELMRNEAERELDVLIRRRRP